MNKLLPFAALTAAVLIVGLARSAWSDETFTGKFAAPTEQTPATANRAVPGGYAQPWQQPPRWRTPQQFFGRMPQPYPPRPQFQSVPQRPATPPVAWENPLSAALKQTQQQLATKSSELEKNSRMLQQLRGKVTYSTREQQALRVRVINLTKTLNTANATLEQQHQLLSDQQAQNQHLTAERDQLHSEAAKRDEQLNALQSELQAAMQRLEQARIQASAARDALNRLEAALGRQESRLQGIQKPINQ